MDSLPWSSSRGVWTVVQCPQCRLYWDKARQQWVRCAWPSEELAQLCVSQLPGNPLELQAQATQQPSSSNSFTVGEAIPILRAQQLPTNVYRNVIHVQLALQGPECLANKHNEEREGVASVVENFYFTCKYCRCETCKSQRSEGHSPAVSSSHLSTPEWRPRSLCAWLRGCWSWARKQHTLETAPNPTRISLGHLDGDCCHVMVAYLPVEALNALSRTSHRWHHAVARELGQFSRLVEAWNLATKVGVYVNLDGVCTPGTGKSGQRRRHRSSSSNSKLSTPEEEEIGTGGYLQLLPISDSHLTAQPSQSSYQPCFFTFDRQQAVTAANSAAVWAYAKPEKPTPSTQPQQHQQPITTTLLQCLLPQQRHVLLRVEQQAQVTRGSPVFSRGSILFPYLASSGAPPDTELLDGNSVSPRRRQLLFSVSFLYSC